MSKSAVNLLILSILVPLNQVFAQQIPEMFADRVAFCNSNFDKSTASQLRLEFQELENYFIKNGLLKDSSGLSYLSVYKQIAKEGDLKFITDLQLKTMETTDLSILRSCSFVLLSQHEMEELTPRHMALSVEMSNEVGNDISLSKIASIITENLTAKDFDLQYYKLTSLLAFYVISKSYEIVGSLVPTTDYSKIKNRILIELNDKDELTISDTTSSMEEVKNSIYKFLSNDIDNKAIEVTAMKQSTYAAYVELLDLINEVYTDLRNQKSMQTFGKPLSELSKDELETVKQQIPKNVIYNKPK
jgi:hypothetical protein